jgi:pimeloyl-ACP methyl ester carboxylesterase
MAGWRDAGPMTVEMAVGVGRSKIDVAYERFGDPGAPPVLLVMGPGTQMLGWPAGFCNMLAGLELHVIRFDNRDVGLSAHVGNAPPPEVSAALAGDTSSATYTLSEMADDAIGLLDALALDSVHIVGASMGGMVAQTAVIEHPDRIRSLTSIMSSTGDQNVGQATTEALGALLSPPATGRDEAMDRAVAIFRVIGSPRFAFDEVDLRQRTAAAYGRAHDPPGVARQLLAVLASPDRTSALRAVEVPTLVIHGAEDRLVDVSGGRATAGAVPAADLVVVDGMGHDLPRTLWPVITGHIAELIMKAELASSTARETTVGGTS